MKISKKKHLEMILEKVPNHPNPKVGLEQYSLLQQLLQI